MTDHHAIIPTGLYRSDLSDTENKVYDLIAKRFIAVFYPACVYSTTTVIGDVSGLKFKATGKTILDPGWRTVYGNDIQEDEKTEILPSFKYGESGQHTPELVEKVLRADLAAVADCDTIYLLSGWTTSEGARRELNVALACNLRIELECVAFDVSALRDAIGDVMQSNNFAYIKDRCAQALAAPREIATCTTMKGDR